MSQQPKKTRPGAGAPTPDAPDARFDVRNDARFRKGGDKKRKIKVDSRFAKMFTDEKFQDGRKTDKIKNRMAEFYQLSGDEEDVAAVPTENAVLGEKKAAKETKPSKESGKKSGKAERLLPAEEDEGAASGGAESDGEVESDGAESDLTDWSESEDDEVDDSLWNVNADCDVLAGDGDGTARPIDRSEELTGARLALQKLDWDVCTAEDIYVVCCSVLGGKMDVEESAVAAKLAGISRKGKFPKKKNGQKAGKKSTSADSSEEDSTAETTGKMGENRSKKVLSVKIFVSELGHAALEQERVHGPKIHVPNTVVGDISEDNNPEQHNEESLRRYAIERSNYYFAVVECASKEVCAKLYDELDGNNIDALADGRPLDARVVPDEVNLNDRPAEIREPTDECSRSTRDYAGVFEGRLRSGLSHSKAVCAWDEGNGLRRKRDLMKKFTKSEMEANDLEVYLASSSEEEGDAESDENEEAAPVKGKGGKVPAKGAVKLLKGRKKKEEELAARRRLLLGAAAGGGEGESSAAEEVGEEEAESSDGDDVEEAESPSGPNGEDEELEEEDSADDHSGQEDDSGEEEEEEDEDSEAFFDDPDAVSEEDGNMEMTFDLDKEKKIKAAAEEIAQKAKAAGTATAVLGKNKSAWEKYQEKRREKKREQKKTIREKRNEIKQQVTEELEALAGKNKSKKKRKNRADAEEAEEDSDLEKMGAASLEQLTSVMGESADKTQSRHFNLRGTSTSAKATAAGRDGFVADVADSRFARLYTDSSFAIDPTLPEFKATAGMQSFLKQKRDADKKKSGKPKQVGKAAARSDTKAASSEEGAGKRARIDSVEPTGDDGGVQLFAKRKKRKA